MWPIRSRLQKAVSAVRGIGREGRGRSLFVRRCRCKVCGTFPLPFLLGGFRPCPEPSHVVVVKWGNGGIWKNLPGYCHGRHMPWHLPARYLPHWHTTKGDLHTHLHDLCKSFVDCTHDWGGWEINAHRSSLVLLKYEQIANYRVGWPHSEPLLNASKMAFSLPMKMNENPRTSQCSPIKPVIVTVTPNMVQKIRT